jgi:hypothetical protein
MSDDTLAGRSAGVTQPDDLVLSHRPDDDGGGEPTVTMSPVRADDRAGAPTGATPAARPPRHQPMHLAPDDEVPFWLQPPPPRPARTAPRPMAEPAPAVPTVPRVPTAPAEPAAPSDPAAAPTSLPDMLFDRPTMTRGAPVPRSPAPRQSLDRAVSVAADATAAGVAALVRLVARARALPQVWLIGAAAAAVGLVAVVGSVVLLTGDGETAVATPRASASAAAAPIDRALVTAAASSTQDPAGKTTYAAANTLDGAPGTAWNSDGKADGAGPGITLTYTFRRPVDLRSISVTNGYQKVVKRSGSTLDLYSANSRLRRVTVVTDTGTWTWDLKDAKAPQAFRQTFGSTRTVTLEIVTVYKGSRYTDVGVSEVAFTGVVKT